MALTYLFPNRRHLLAQPPRSAGQADDLTVVLSRAELARAIGETFLREAHQRAAATVGGSGKPSGRNVTKPVRRWRILAASCLVAVALVIPLALFGKAIVARKTSVAEKSVQLAIEEPAVQSHPLPAALKEDLSVRQPQGMHGTSLDFVCTPAEAAKQAAAQGKLVFLLHISGNFEDSGFT
jgi:hypothetical protein